MSSEKVLKIHIKNVHEKLMLFYCTICDYKSSYKQYMKKHIDVVHKQIRSFQCKICQKRFGFKSQFKKHLQQKHENTAAKWDHFGTEKN
jgi:hypothetical protein